MTVSSPHYKKNQLHRGGLGEAHLDYVSKISMLRLNIGSGMLRLSSCMLRLSLDSSVQGGGGRQTLWRGGCLDQ